MQTIYRFDTEVEARNFYENLKAIYYQEQRMLRDASELNGTPYRQQPRPNNYSVYQDGDQWVVVEIRYDRDRIFDGLDPDRAGDWEEAQAIFNCELEKLNQERWDYSLGKIYNPYGGYGFTISAYELHWDGSRKGLPINVGDENYLKYTPPLDLEDVFENIGMMSDALNKYDQFRNALDHQQYDFNVVTDGNGMISFRITNRETGEVEDLSDPRRNDRFYLPVFRNNNLLFSSRDVSKPRNIKVLSDSGRAEFLPPALLPNDYIENSRTLGEAEKKLQMQLDSGEKSSDYDYKLYQLWNDRFSFIRTPKVEPEKKDPEEVIPQQSTTSRVVNNIELAVTRIDNGLPQDIYSLPFEHQTISDSSGENIVMSISIENYVPSSGDNNTTGGTMNLDPEAGNFIYNALEEGWLNENNIVIDPGKDGNNPTLILNFSKDQLPEKLLENMFPETQQKEDSIKTTGDIGTGGGNMIRNFFADAGVKTTGSDQPPYSLNIVIKNLIVNNAAELDEKKIIEDMLATLSDANNSAGGLA